MPITIGDTKLPNKIPNLNHIFFKGIKNIEFKRPRIKKNKDIINDQILKSPSFSNG